MIICQKEEIILEAQMSKAILSSKVKISKTETFATTSKMVEI